MAARRAVPPLPLFAFALLALLAAGALAALHGPAPPAPEAAPGPASPAATRDEASPGGAPPTSLPRRASPAASLPGLGLPAPPLRGVLGPAAEASWAFEDTLLDGVEVGMETVPAVDPSGRIWVAGMGGADRPDSYLWNLTGGVVARDDPPGTGKADATIYPSAADGRLHWAVLDNPGGAPDTVRLAARTPAGAWVTTEPGMRPFDRPWFTSAGNATYLVLTRLAQGAGVEWWEQLAGQDAWTKRAELGSGIGNLPQVVAAPGPGGSVEFVVPITVTDPLSPHPMELARSTDLGATWTRAAVPHTAGNVGHVQSAVDAAGNLYLVHPGATGGLNYTVRFPDGTWGPSVRVNGTAGETVYGGAVAAGAQGRIDVAWYSQAPRPNHGLPQPWQVHLVQVTQAHATPEVGAVVVAVPFAVDRLVGPQQMGDVVRDYLAMTRDADGDAVVSYTCMNTDPVLAALCPADGLSHPKVVVQTAGPRL